MRHDVIAKPDRHPSARIVLRTATDAIHQRMHHHAGYAMLADGSISAAGYRALLARSFGFHQPVEPLAGMDGRATTNLISDLIALGLTPAAIAALPRCALPAIGSSAVEQIGAAYVLTGASLGGKVLARAVPGPLPTRFLANEGADGSEWRSVLRILEETCASDDNRALATESALTIFSALEDWMSGWMPTDAA